MANVALHLMGSACALFAALSIWNGSLVITGLANIPPGRGNRYHTFAQRLWLAMSVLWTVGLYAIVFGSGLA